MTRDFVGEALGEGKSWRDGLITAKALQTKAFAPVRIILPGLIPEGVTIAAGKPKIGKSWLALDVCAAVAGDRFVGCPCTPGRRTARSKEPNDWHLRWLLRACRERPSNRRAAEQRDELAAFHSTACAAV